VLKDVAQTNGVTAADLVGVGIKDFVGALLGTGVLLDDDANKIAEIFKSLLDASQPITDLVLRSGGSDVISAMWGEVLLPTITWAATPPISNELNQISRNFMCMCTSPEAVQLVMDFSHIVLTFLNLISTSDGKSSPHPVEAFHQSLSEISLSVLRFWGGGGVRGFFEGVGRTRERILSGEEGGLGIWIYQTTEEVDSSEGEEVEGDDDDDDGDGDDGDGDDDDDDDDDIVDNQEYAISDDGKNNLTIDPELNISHTSSTISDMDDADGVASFLRTAPMQSPYRNRLRRRRGEKKSSPSRKILNPRIPLAIASVTAEICTAMTKLRVESASPSADIAGGGGGGEAGRIHTRRDVEGDVVVEGVEEAVLRTLGRGRSGREEIGESLSVGFKRVVRQQKKNTDAPSAESKGREDEGAREGDSFRGDVWVPIGDLEDTRKENESACQDDDDTGASVHCQQENREGKEGEVDRGFLEEGLKHLGFSIDGKKAVDARIQKRKHNSRFHRATKISGSSVATTAMKPVESEQVKVYLLCFSMICFATALIIGVIAWSALGCYGAWTIIFRPLLFSHGETTASYFRESDEL